ncbi:MAG: hypothetical protein LAN62_09775 [Acidobacteriia bacterium]|nr:hypothetical protein [Terriglobia bacterium]
MDSPFVIPLAIFALVVILVALVKVAKVRDQEMEVQRRLHLEELEHRRKMQALQVELERVKAKS